MHTSLKHLILSLIKKIEKLDTSREIRVIGRLEKILLPSLSKFTLDAKIDTGAYTSSLHCHNLELYKIKDRQWVKFYVLDPSHPEYDDIPFESPVYKIKNIRSSNGIVSERVIIKQNVLFCGEKNKIQLSLSNRSDMKFPVLIGRRYLSGKYIVDVSKKFIYK